MTPASGLKRWLVLLGLSLPVLVVASFTPSAPSGASTATTDVPAGGTTRTTVTPAPGGPCRNSEFKGQRFRPAFVRRTLRAVPAPPTPSYLPNSQPVGASVAKADLV